METLASLLADLVVTRSVAAALSIVLIAGAWQKLRDLALFAAAVDNYRLLPGWLVAPVAYLLPVVELTAGVLLLFPETVLSGALLSSALLCAVTGAVIVNLQRGRTSIDCGCGGLSGQPLSWGLVSRNLVLMLLTGIAALQVAERPLVWADYFTAGGAVLALLGLYVSANQLMTNAPMALAIRK